MMICENCEEQVAIVAMGRLKLCQKCADEVKVKFIGKMQTMYGSKVCIHVECEHPLGSENN